MENNNLDKLTKKKEILIHQKQEIATKLISLRKELKSQELSLEKLQKDIFKLELLEEKLDAEIDNNEGNVLASNCTSIESLLEIPCGTVFKKPIIAKIKLPKNIFFDSEFLDVSIISKKDTRGPCSGYGTVYFFRSVKEIEGKDENSIAWGFREEKDELLILILVGKVLKMEDGKQLYDKVDGFLIPKDNVMVIN